ncbi:MAG: DNA polymerase III subunit gamma/tau [Verrucomicrobia bacterium]|nr:DNA polymerase III subunit gamma/tau [Verrucomicrobiota bacterium]
MEKYQIIPRKFRPKRFCDVFGQDATVTTLKNALSQGRIGQAYLFCGSRGCGKTTLARLFAKSLNCTQLVEGYEPCCSCISCVEIAEGRSLDVIEIDGASNRGIDDIRQINETVGYAPSRGHYKIYIIDEVHMLTKEAFNALLKTLEEPPKHVKFFFATTEPHKLPPTIISRCQRFNLVRIPERDLVEKLRWICTNLNVTAEEEALIQISHLSEGSLRDAESMLDQLICAGQTTISLDVVRTIFGLLTHDLLAKLDEVILTHNLDGAVALAREFYESGKDIGAALDSLLEHFRTYLLIQLGQPARGIYKKGAYTSEQCLVMLDKMILWQQSMQKTPFKQIHLEMLLLDLTRSLRKISLESLVTRLIELEARLKTEAPVETAVIEKAPEIPEPIAVVIEKAPEEKGSETQTSIPEPPSKKDEPIKKQPQPPKQHPSKYDTLIRFAAVELDGSVK